MEEKEIQYIEQCQQGNMEKFAKLYDKYAQAIYNFIYYKTMHKQTAEDITSLTFFKAMDKIETFNSKDNFKAWLYKIARNSVIDHYRTSKATTNIETIWDISDQQSIVQQVDDKIKLDKVSTYLENFNKKQREIIMMRLWDGLSYQEIALITGQSEDNCRILVSRGLKKIKQTLIVSLALIILSAILCNS